jgi:hypothetical protein
MEPIDAATLPEWFTRSIYLSDVGWVSDGEAALLATKPEGIREIEPKLNLGVGEEPLLTMTRENGHVVCETPVELHFAGYLFDLIETTYPGVTWRVHDRRVVAWLDSRPVGALGPRFVKETWRTDPPIQIRCPDCGGSGAADCEICEGTGSVGCECESCGDDHDDDCDAPGCDGGKCGPCARCGGSGGWTEPKPLGRGAMVDDEPGTTPDACATDEDLHREPRAEEHPQIKFDVKAARDLCTVTLGPRTRRKEPATYDEIALARHLTMALDLLDAGAARAVTDEEERERLRARLKDAEGQLTAIDSLSEGVWEDGSAATWVHKIRSGQSLEGLPTQEAYLDGRVKR